MQRIPLSDEYDPDSDFASDIGDPIENFVTHRRHSIPFNAEERRTLPSIIGHEAEIAVARRNRADKPQPKQSRKYGC